MQGTAETTYVHVLHGTWCFLIIVAILRCILPIAEHPTKQDVVAPTERQVLEAHTASTAFTCILLIWAKVGGELQSSTAMLISDLI